MEKSLAIDPLKKICVKTFKRLYLDGEKSSCWESSSQSEAKIKRLKKKKYSDPWRSLRLRDYLS